MSSRILLLEMVTCVSKCNFLAIIFLFSNLGVVTSLLLINYRKSMTSPLCPVESYMNKICLFPYSTFLIIIVVLDWIMKSNVFSSTLFINILGLFVIVITISLPPAHFQCKQDNSTLALVAFKSPGKKKTTYKYTWCIEQCHRICRLDKNGKLYCTCLNFEDPSWVRVVWTLWVWIPDSIGLFLLASLLTCWCLFSLSPCFLQEAMPSKFPTFWWK